MKRIACHMLAQVSVTSYARCMTQRPYDHALFTEWKKELL